MLVLDDTAVAEARLLHPIREGFFTVAQKRACGEGGKPWHEASYAMSSLDQVLAAVSNVPDFYISQASFVTRRRLKSGVNSLSASFVDLDCYKLGILPDDATIKAIVDLAESRGLPPPSYIMSSGRGLYAKWIYDRPLTGMMIHHWERLQSVLGHLFMAFGADFNAKDVSRVLRASSTLNSKSGEVVRVAYKSNRIYRFADLAAQAAKLDTTGFIEATKARQRVIRAKQDSLAAIPSDLSVLTEYSASREPVMMERFSRQSLNWGRFLDVRDLMILRNGAAKGSRDAFLFWMTAFLGSSGVIEASNFWGEVEALLGAFPVSEDFNPLQDGSLGALQRRIEKHSRGEKVEFKGGKVSPIYTPSNDYIIDVLSITDDEMRNLRTIISGAEKRRRADLKVPGRSERRAERQELRVMAAQLQRDGKTITQIAQELEVNKSTISRWLAPSEVNKTRDHERYLATRWDAKRIEEWMEKRRQAQAQRHLQQVLMRTRQESLEEAKKAQTSLKISVRLMSIYEKAMASEATATQALSHRAVAAHPLEPPIQDASSAWQDVQDDDDYFEEDDGASFERPRG